jgi:polyisoprenoid-binding protein YceI
MLSIIALLLTWPWLAAAAPGYPVPPVKAPSTPVIYRYEVIPGRSRVSFFFRGLILPHDAFFNLVRGQILLMGGDDPFEGASGRIEVETASVRAGDLVHEGILRKQVLEVERYPIAELRVSEARSLGPPERRGREQDWEVQARGTLSLHGVQRQVSVRFALDDTGAELYVRGEGELLLSDFGMSRPATLLLIPGSDVVRVNVRLVARPEPHSGGR